MYRCRICSQEFSEIPKDAIAINEPTHGYRLWEFPDGTVHSLREVKRQSMTQEALSARGKLAAHTRRHRNIGIQKENCAFCFPKEKIMSTKSRQIAEEKKS